MKVLIVALPKSASTSLQKLLSQNLDLRPVNSEVRQLAFKYYIRSINFKALFAKPNPLCFWHSDLFYGSEAIISALEDIDGPYIAKLHIGKLDTLQYKRLTNSVDKVIYCRREVQNIVAAYQRGEENGIYPNLLGRTLTTAVKQEMVSLLRQLDRYWSTAAHEVVDFNQLTQNDRFILMENEYNASDLPKERFSRGEKHRSKGRLLRQITLRLERLLIQSGINALLLRRLILGLFAKY